MHMHMHMYMNVCTSSRFVYDRLSFAKIVLIPQSSPRRPQGPDQCVACQNFFLEIREDGQEVTLCVEECPFGTYRTEGLTQCLPCHDHCREAGCVGELPYLDRNNGCLECGLVQLQRNGSQVQRKIL